MCRPDEDRIETELTYLVLGTANWTLFPLRTAQVHQLLPNAFVRLFGQPVVDAGELLAEEALGAAVVPDCASACLMFRGIQVVSSRDGREEEDPSRCQGREFDHLDQGWCRAAALG